MKKYFLALAVLLFLAAPSFAQVTSPVVSINLSMTVGESLTVTASSATDTFTYNGSTASDAGPITITTSWNLNSGRSLSTYAAFANPAQALVNGSAAIPTSDVFASINGGTPTACTQSPSGGMALASCPTIFSSTTPPQSGTHSDTIDLSLAGLTGIVPGTYTGTLFVQAKAI